MKTLPGLIFPLLLITACLSLNAQKHSDTVRVLFAGNSHVYTKNLPQLVSLISEDTDIKLVTRKSTVGGANFSEHWHGKRGLKTKEIIKAGNFDILVLQNHSMAALDRPDSLLEYGSLLCKYAREHGARPIFYTTWAREQLPQMQSEVNKVYDRAARENNTIAVPVGNAWSLAMDYRPGLKLHSPDGNHASDHGVYLTATVFVLQLSGSLPEKMPAGMWINDEDGESVQLLHMDPMDGYFLKKVAEEILEVK